MNNLNHAPALTDIEPVLIDQEVVENVRHLQLVTPETPEKPLLLERVGEVAAHIGSTAVAVFNVAFFGRH